MKIEYRITQTPPAQFATLADDNGAAPQKISAWKPGLRATPQTEALAVGVGSALATFIQARAGHVTLGFAVDQQNASADAALAFALGQISTFSVASNFDLQITVGAAEWQMPNCACTQIEPDEHSDQHTFIRYAFTGSQLTKIA